VHEAHKQKPTIQKDSKRTAGGGGVGEERSASPALASPKFDARKTLILYKSLTK